MYAHIRGILSEKLADSVVIDASGVGYELSVSANTLASCPQTGEEVKLYAYLSVREDAMELFGFASKEEKQLFLLLTGVNGVGPKMALALLSTLSASDLRLAIIMEDDKTLARAPGVGKKIAQRIILELKDKLGGSAMELDFSMGAAAAAPDPAQTGNKFMAHAALQELGYSPAEIRGALKDVDPNASTEEMIRHALRAMVMKG